MKKLFLLSITLIGFSLLSNAQDISDHAIGLRLGDSGGFGSEISYQRDLKANNRLELDLGWVSRNKNNGFKLAGLYQWVWALEGDINWYAGVGGGIGSYEYDIPLIDKTENDTFIFVAGDIGIEYSFNIPLQLSLDTRPEIDFGNYRSGLYFDLALGIRYLF